MQNTNNAKTKLKDEKASERVLKLYSRPFKIKCKNSNLTGYSFNLITKSKLNKVSLNGNRINYNRFSRISESVPNYIFQ